MSSRAAKNRPGVKKRRPLAVALGIVAVLLAFFASCLLAGLLALNSWFKDLPDYRSADAFNTAMPTYVYAADRKTVLARFQMEYREPVERSKICDDVVNATISIEDARFYEHSGIDYYGVMRALVNNLTGRSFEGGSTITQQFVRNTILADEMDDISIKRKVREAYIAVELEKMYSKDDILLMYLNTINYGAGAHGIEAAAQRYFSKSAKKLTLSESALLAGIPQSPTYNDPLQYPDRALSRRNIVLDRMCDEHYITEQERDKAKAEPLGLKPKDIKDDGIIAYPYFTSYVRYLLYNNYDLSEADILKGGLSVYTTLDVDKQLAAEAACATKRESMWNDSMEVAMAVVEPNTGNIQAIVGGSDYSQSQVNIATGQGGGGRPCGSVFKTFTLVQLIKDGIDPNSTYVDCSSPATVDGYTLENYDNTSYGTRSIASAFAISSNTGFVRLISSVGADRVAATAYDMGVTTDLDPDVTGAPLTLGVQNVTPLDLANSVATIANGGTHHDLCAVTEIQAHDGKVIYQCPDPADRAKQVLTPEEAHAVQEVMQGVVNGGTGTAAAMYNGQPVGGKTGTSEDYKDISFVGITPFTAAAIWVGDPTNVNSVPTGSCADVFRYYTAAIMDDENIPVQDFDDVGYPAYHEYEDEEHQVYNSSTYQVKRAEEERIEQERAEQARREEAQKKKEEQQQKKKEQKKSSSSKKKK